MDKQHSTPFVATQKFRLLTEVDEPWPFTAPEYLRSERWEREDSRVRPWLRERGDDARKLGPEGRPDPWVEVPRLDVARDTVQLDGQPWPLARMVLLNDGGVGKTTNTQWMQFVLSRPGSSALAFWLTLAELPAVELPVDTDDFLRRVLLPKLRLPLANRADAGVSDDVLLGVLRRARDQGRLVLLFDGADQTRGDGAAELWLPALIADPLWATTRIIVSGRPHGFERFLADDALFGLDLKRWRFVKLDEFTEDELRAYLGQTDGDQPGTRQDKLDLIPREAWGIASVPRVAEYLATKLTRDQLRTIRTPADVYAYATDHMLREGLAADLGRGLGRENDKLAARDELDKQVRLARKLLAALAFEMTLMLVPPRLRPGQAPPKTPPAKVPNFDRIAGGTELDNFYELVYERVKKPRYEGAFPQLEDDLERLRRLNEILAHGLFDTLDTFQWRNRSLQEFFTAYWLANYATAEDAEKIRAWMFLEHEPATREYYWVWRYLAEMPCDPLPNRPQARVAEHWLRAASVLYVPQPGQPPAQIKRSSEMLYRSWSTMSAYAAQGETKAIEALEKFRGAGHAQAVKELSSEMKLISPWYLEFWLGSPKSEEGRWDSEPEQHEAKLDRPFELACYAVTNAQYELFDLSHQSRRSTVSTDDRCPVVNVTWYDSWAYCAWLGAEYRLPTEEERECAARAGSRGRWCFGEAEAELEKYAWYSKNSERRTHPVGGKKANEFGLFDMHGNVWEWCGSWWSDPYVRGGDLRTSARVIRGGSWGLNPRLSRSAFRVRGTPTGSFDDRGFRVARAVPENL